jgi:acyl dehydratase
MDVKHLLSHRFPAVTQSYDDAFTILYGISVGLGADPMDERQLPYVYEEGLRAFPTMAVVLATPGFWAQDPQFGIDWKRVLHGEQGLTIHKPLPPTGTVVGRLRVTAIDDKGAEKGAVIRSERTLEDAAGGDRLATLEQTTFARGDGGFGGVNVRRDNGWERPAREPDAVCDLPTRPDGALLYRLTGDRNPLHADPAVARVGGFDRPILHGLCTYGLIAHALVSTEAGYDADRLRGISGRFSSPVVPGEVISTSIWRGDGDGELLFEAKGGDGRVVFTHGKARLDR